MDSEIDSAIHKNRGYIRKFERWHSTGKKEKSGRSQRIMDSATELKNAPIPKQIQIAKGKESHSPLCFIGKHTKRIKIQMQI